MRCAKKSNLFNKSATTLNATIAWLENGVSQRLVYTSDIYASKTGTTEFSEIVNNKSISRNMGRRNTLILFLIITNSQN